jgi:hypothetical protein
MEREMPQTSAPVAVELSAAVISLLGDGASLSIGTLRTVLDPSRSGRVLAYRDSPGVTFIAVNTTSSHASTRAVQRSAVVLKEGEAMVITYDIALADDETNPITWSIQGSLGSFGIRRLLPASGSKGTGETAFLHAIGLKEKIETVIDISSLGLAGVVAGGWAVLFHTEPRSAQSGVSFLVEGDSKLNILVTGLAPGSWEIWRNGWLEEAPGIVTPSAGSMHFEGRAGSYFLRRRG